MDFIICNVRIFTGEETYEPGYIHVDNGVIRSVGPGAPPDDSLLEILVLSKPGHTILPGLIDAHIHANGGNPLALQQSFRFGVTTVMDMHNSPPYYTNLKKLAREKTDVADFKCACIAATIENGWPIPVVTAHDKSPELGGVKTLAEIKTWPKLKTAEDVEVYLDRSVAEGADYIKLMNESGRAFGHNLSIPSQNLQRMIIEGTHRRGLKAVAHATSLEDTISVLEAGVDGMTHTVCDQPPTLELIQAYKKNNAWLNPTLATISSLTGEGKAMAEKFANDERAKGLIGDVERERMCKCLCFCTETSKLEYAFESVRQLKAAGIDIVCGSDAATPALGTAWGLSIHHELHLFVYKCGFSPEEALRSVTSVTARRFGFADRGRLSAGCKADLLLVEGNPTADIRATLNIRGVWRDGSLGERFSMAN